MTIRARARRARMARVAPMVVVLLGACGGGATRPASTGPGAATAASTSASAAPPASASASSLASTPPPPPKPTLLELQKKCVRSVIEAFDAHHSAELAALYAPDAVIVEQGLTGVKETRGREEIERLYAGIFRSFPDAKLGVSRVFAAREVLVEELAWAGTNTGPTPLGGKPTNKLVGERAASIQALGEGGLIQREELFMDDLTTLQQLGVAGFSLAGGKPRAVPELAVGEPQWVVEADDASLLAAKTAGWPSLCTKHDRKAFEGLLTDDTLHFDATLALDAKGKRALLAEYDQWLRTLPDLAVVVGAGWGFQDGWAVYAFIASGTMKGAWGPNRPTNKAVVVHGVAIDRFDGGKLAQWSTYSNGAEPLGEINPPKPPRR